MHAYTCTYDMDCVSHSHVQIFSTHITSIVSPSSLLPQMVVHLRQRVQELREELAMVTGEQRSDELTEEEKDKWAIVTNWCTLRVHCYFKGVMIAIKARLGDNPTFVRSFWPIFLEGGRIWKTSIKTANDNFVRVRTLDRESVCLYI